MLVSKRGCRNGQAAHQKRWLLCSKNNEIGKEISHAQTRNTGEESTWFWRQSDSLQIEQRALKDLTSVNYGDQVAVLHLDLKGSASSLNGSSWGKEAVEQ